MSQRVFCFVVVLIFFFNGEIFSQQNVENFFNKNLVRASDSIFFRGFFKNKINKPAKLPEAAVELNKPINFYLVNPLPPNFYGQRLSFFCRKELQIEKMTAIPFRFRLGSLEYVNYLEQKPNALKPN